MNDNVSSKWLNFCFFSITGFCFVSLVYYLVTFTPDPANKFGVATATAGTSVPQSTAPDSIYLKRGKMQSIDGLQITYRGIEAGALLIDVTLIDLDPDYAYRRRIPRNTALQGFQMASRHFKLLSINRFGLKLSLCRG
mgnify:CR=1 FL=1